MKKLIITSVLALLLGNVFIPSVMAENYQQGDELLSSSWHQKWPYNRYCEDMGCTNPDLNGRAKVGCMAVAAAQIMRYWAWPPYKTPFSVSYAWPNMPNVLDANSPQIQIDAVATLCREVGGEAGMDYKCDVSIACLGSGWCDRSIRDAFADHFKYHTGANYKERGGDDQEWFDIIKNNLNKNRLVQYGIELTSVSVGKKDDKDKGHSMVCDGWREVNGYPELHMNWGAGGSKNDWYRLDAFSGKEAIIRRIRPAPSLGSGLSEDPPDKHVDYWADSPDCDPRGDGYGFRYFDQDAMGRNVTFHHGHYLQFLPGVKVTGTSPIGDYIRFTGTSSENTRLFSIKGTQTGGIVAGIRIYNGGIRLYNNGSIRLH